MRTQLDTPLTKVIHNLALLLDRQTVNLILRRNDDIGRIRPAAAVIHAGANALALGGEGALGALAGDVCLDAFAGLRVGDEPLGDELLRGEGPVAELRGAAVEVVFCELHGCGMRGGGFGFGGG